MMEETTQYITTDLYLAAFLKTKGHIILIEKNGNKFNFIFNSSDEFFVDVNSYLLGNGSCDALSYSNSIKNLKNYLHNNK